VADNGGTAALRLITLGAMRLVDASGRDMAPGQRKLLALLTYLALEAPRAVSREEVATLLWGERPDDNARGSLRQALFQLKRIVGDALDVTPTTIGLRAGALDVDVAAMEADVARGGYREAALRWHGELLAGAEDVGAEPFREWLAIERARTRKLAARAFDTLTAEAAARGAWAEAASWAERWADVEPLDEGPTRRLVEALSLAGRSAEALARHAGFVARLRAELGTGPSEAFVRLGSQLERRARAAATSGPRGSAALLPPDLVGRADAFAALTAAWRDVRRGRPVVVVIEGDAGVGKTRLLEEFLRGVEGSRGEAVVLRARARADDRDTPLATARELLARLCDAPGLLGAPRGALVELATVVPALADQLGGRSAPATSARALDEAVARVLADVAAEVPVLAVVDDVSRADPESRRLVLSVCRRLEDAHVLVVLTTAPDDLRRHEELREATDARWVRLRPLDVPDVESMLASMLRLPADERHSLAERLTTEVGGWPLDVVATLTALLDQGRLAPDGAGVWRMTVGARGERLPLAAPVREAIGRRIEAVGERAREALEAMAIVGRRVDPALLAEVVGVDRPAITDAIQELGSRALVRAVADASDAAPLHEVASDALRRVTAERIPDDRRAALRAGVTRRGGPKLRVGPFANRALEALDARYVVGPPTSEGKVVWTYEARDLRDGREVELHVVRGMALTGAESFLETMERAAAFTHPNLTPVADFGVTPDALFYATARVQGSSLRERLARERPLPVEDALRVAREVAAALHGAHAAGIVHGDLRPKHVTLTPRGVSLAGLGVVQALGAAEAGHGPERTGVTFGAPAYLSPEQLSGEASADARSDIYSWGGMLYEMLAGELPFTGSSQSVIARKLTQAAPSVRTRRDAVPKQVDRVLRACLARVPADRPASLAKALEGLRGVV
jgi:DNA-binding SARP family transcriptional activator